MSKDNQKVAKKAGSQQQNDYNTMRPTTTETLQGGALSVTVDRNIERAIKILKRKIIKEGLFKELKSRRYYEKPSEKKKRKLKESMKKIRKDQLRKNRSQVMF